jgi:hypothetical protein
MHQLCAVLVEAIIPAASLRSCNRTWHITYAAEDIHTSCCWHHLQGCLALPPNTIDCTLARFDPYIMETYLDDLRDMKRQVYDLFKFNPELLTGPELSKGALHTFVSTIETLFALKLSTRYPNSQKLRGLTASCRSCVYLQAACACWHACVYTVTCQCCILRRNPQQDPPAAGTIR